MSRVAIIGAALMALVPSSAFAVDGTILIDQNRALAGNVTPGDAPGFPVTITRAGSYRLSGNLDVPANAIGISVTADRVSLDLNGFTIRMADAGGSVGFGVASANANVALANGFVTGFSSGVALLGTGARVESVSAVDNEGFGIVVGPGAVVRGCTARGNEVGIEIRGAGLLTNNNVSNNANFGVTAVGHSGIPGGNTLINNTVAENGNIGIQVVCPSAVIGNTAVNNVSLNLQAINSASCVLVNNVAP
jgi:hypothetical protein